MLLTIRMDVTEKLLCGFKRQYPDCTLLSTPPLALNTSNRAGVSPLFFHQVCYLSSDWNVCTCIPRKRRSAGLNFYWLTFSEDPFTVACLCACEGVCVGGGSIFFSPNLFYFT